MGESSDMELRQRFARILVKAKDLGLTAEDLEQLECIDELAVKRKSRFGFVWRMQNFVKRHPTVLSTVLVAFIVVFCVICAFDWPMSKRSILNHYYNIYDLDITKENCIIEIHEKVADLARPPVNCQMCDGIKSVDRIAKISQSRFEVDYAYSGRPLVITDGAINWTATDIFSFKFFQSIYSEDSPALIGSKECQFFPYKTSFKSLAEVFNMSEERAQLKDGAEPWYVGWSNCDAAAADILRKHYDRPYFLPRDAESSKTDWIFMGSPGYGAHMHIDSVRNPSWQAQILGTKLWMLEPPPECYQVCEPRIETTVHPGEIIVLDTNQWFHSTLIVGDEMSITIGSEYD